MLSRKGSIIWTVFGMVLLRFFLYYHYYTVCHFWNFVLSLLAQWINNFFFFFFFNPVLYSTHINQTKAFAVVSWLISVGIDFNDMSTCLRLFYTYELCMYVVCAYKTFPFLLFFFEQSYLIIFKQIYLINW